MIISIFTQKRILYSKDLEIYPYSTKSGKYKVYLDFIPIRSPRRVGRVF